MRDHDKARTTHFGDLYLVFRSCQLISTKESKRERQMAQTEGNIPHRLEFLPLLSDIISAPLSPPKISTRQRGGGHSFISSMVFIRNCRWFLSSSFQNCFFFGARGVLQPTLRRWSNSLEKNLSGTIKP
jgi:hypothetical protein